MKTVRTKSQTPSYHLLKKMIENKSYYTAGGVKLCKACESDQPMIKSAIGLVCPNCGLVVESPQFEIIPQYKNDELQYVPIGKTQIGNHEERRKEFRFYRLNKINTIDYRRSNEERVNLRAKSEINRIMNIIQIPLIHKKPIYSLFKRIRDSLNPGTKFRCPEKLVPISIYYYLKLSSLSINEKDLLSISKISEKEFNAFKLQIVRYLPEYKQRNRMEYVLNKLMEVTEEYSLPLDFYYQSKATLLKLWDHIKNTTDNVVAGIVSSITLLCNSEDKVSIHAISKSLGCSMSSIQRNVKKKIIDKFHISGFKSLVKSADLLKKVMLKLGVQDLGNKYSERFSPDEFQKQYLENYSN